MTFFFVQTVLSTKSVRLMRDGQVLGEKTWDTAGSEAANLLPALQHLLHEHALGWEDVSGMLVVTGPGSFTGLRITIATIRTISYVYPLLKVVGVTIGEVLAYLHNKSVVFQPYPSDLFLFDEKGAFVERRSSADLALSPLPQEALVIRYDDAPLVSHDYDQLFSPEELTAFLQSREHDHQITPFYAKQPNISIPKTR